MNERNNDGSPTPTGDAAETYLRSLINFTPSRRLKEHHRFGILVAEITADPYYIENVAYHVFQFLGYPLEIKIMPATYIKQTPRYLRNRSGRETVFTNDLVSKARVDKVFQEIFDYDIEELLRAVGDGQPAKLMGALQGDTSWIYPDVSNRQIGLEFRPIIEKCFLRARERADERNELFGVSFPDADQDRLFKELTEKGIRPIDPEAMGLLLVPVIRDIQRKNPELIP